MADTTTKSAGDYFTQISTHIYTPSITTDGMHISPYIHPYENVQDTQVWYGLNEIIKSIPKSVHFSSAKSDWRTPKVVFEWLQLLGQIGLDPCASSNESEQFAACNYTEKDNGLSMPWYSLSAHGYAYVNPPYGRKIGLWTDKAALEAKKGAEVVLLLPARPDTAWWQRMVKEANAVCFLKGRLKFEGAAHGAPFPSALVYFGGRPSVFVEAMESHGWCISNA